MKGSRSEGGGGDRRWEGMISKSTQSNGGKEEEPWKREEEGATTEEGKTGVAVRKIRFSFEIKEGDVRNH